jgi:hypothetical protein
MAKTKNTSVGVSASLKPKKLKGNGQSKVYSFVIPKFGRFAYTRDPGEAKLFMSQMLSTSLGAILRGPDYSVRGQMHLGPVLDEFDLGSGLVTNIGVTALANDSNWVSEAVNLSTLKVCDFIAWGTGATAAAQTDWQLQTPSENEAGKKEAVAATTSSLSFAATGNAKLIVTGTLEANLAGPTAITEWGLFSAAKIEGEAKKAATSTSATELKDTVKLVVPGSTASATKVRGAQQYVVEATEAEVVYGLILKNTTEAATVPGWVKSAKAETGATPSGTSKYTIKPVMWDHRVFAAINVEKGNKIEFPYELTIEGGH